MNKRDDSDARRSSMEVRHDVLWGWLWTFGMMFAAGLVVVIQYLVVGPELLSKYGVTFEQVIVAYTVSALGAGVFLGLLRPLAHEMTGGAVLGFLLAFAFYLPIGLIMDRLEGVSFTTTLWSAAAISVLFGIPAGVYFSKHGFGR